MSNSTPAGNTTLIDGPVRAIEPEWNHTLIAASIAISLLGAFTSTQLMCQARTSYHFRTVLVWALLASITFGFCSVWCLHEVAMLACELDLPVGVDAWLTTLSALLATAFTFAALCGDLLWDRWRMQKGRRQRRASRKSPKPKKPINLQNKNMWNVLPHQEEYGTQVPEATEMSAEEAYQDDIEEADESRPLTGSIQLQESAVLDEEEELTSPDEESQTITLQASPDTLDGTTSHLIPVKTSSGGTSSSDPVSPKDVRTQAAFVIQQENEARRPSSMTRTDSESTSTRSLSNASSFGLNSLVNVAWLRTSSPVQNVFVLTATTLWAGLIYKNIVKGFFWSLAITSMHYVGIAGLVIPHGYYKLNPFLFLASALISWIVCLVGCIFMAQMETHLPQQVLFSVVASTGVAAMHFTGMRATTFYTTALPTADRGYPKELPFFVGTIAVVTCIAANGLLSHTATVSRNKLAEIVYTRKQLWRTIAQKENAEAAAAARSDFIASASHEIRTPLHHLQGYSDLLSRTELTEEGRMLLACIQRATQTLSLITNNVLDWSRLEKDAEGICRPIALDLRTVCESVIVLLPNNDEEAEVELLVVVTPDVPHSLFLDETYIHRILMNLLSNAKKFTRSGYIALTIEMKDGRLVASVTDTGVGVPPSFLPIMFEPFKQAQTRGSQRGTGLGLSIIKQLLSKMGGTIDVESKYFEEPGVEASETGSMFTISLPVQTVHNNALDMPAPPQHGKIAIFHAGNSRAAQGIARCFDQFGYKAVICQNESDLANPGFDFVWADLPALKGNSRLLKKLLRNSSLKVLIPCDTLNSPQEISALASPPSHFVYLTRPLIWHTFEERIAAALQHAPVAKEVRFASHAEVIGSASASPTVATSTPHQTSQPSKAPKAPPKATILLVEDNPINARLGSKMLTSLNYTTILAVDGLEALDKIRTHDNEVEVILMDQSMPRMDGLTATQKIREMETAGILTGGRRHGNRRVIIAVTAVVSAEAEKAFEVAGADGFLAKPLSMKKLEETLDRYLNGNGNSNGG